jgi:hypothetical protein
MKVLKVTLPEDSTMGDSSGSTGKLLYTLQLTDLLCTDLGNNERNLFGSGVFIRNRNM